MKSENKRFLIIYRLNGKKYSKVIEGRTDLAARKEVLPTLYYRDVGRDDVYDGVISCREM